MIALPASALSASSGAGGARGGGPAQWSAGVDRRYSRTVPDRAAETRERSDLEESFSDGGDAAVRIVYDRYGSMVYTFCRRTVGHDDATEVAQDVFVAAWRAQRSYDPIRGGWRHVRTIDTGVDVDYFRPTSDPVVSDRVLFLGSMDWLPNQDGVEYFVREVWPLIRRARPGATFQVVGRNPPPPIRALGDVLGVEVIGTVLDVRPYLAEAAAVVVPLRIGGGTRLKIFEAMAAGKAVVSSTVGCEGLPVTPGRHLLVEDDPGAFAAAVTRLLASPNERAGLENAARRLVAEQYGSEQVARQFDQICRDVVAEVATVGAQCAVAAT